MVSIIVKKDVDIIQMGVMAMNRIEERMMETSLASSKAIKAITELTIAAEIFMMLISDEKEWDNYEY